MTHSPILIDDFIGDVLTTEENMKPAQAKLLSAVINYIARHGYGALPLHILWKAAQCMLFYGMKYGDIVNLYTKHAGDWGGASRVYRFDAVKDGVVVKSVTKKPMNEPSLELNTYKTQLCERESYDVTAIRIRAVDENGNTLTFCSEPLRISVSGPVEIIGADVVALRGGMSGVYIKTTGSSGSATVTVDGGSLGSVSVDLNVKQA